MQQVPTNSDPQLLVIPAHLCMFSRCLQVVYMGQLTPLGWVVLIALIVCQLKLQYSGFCLDVIIMCLLPSKLSWHHIVLASEHRCIQSALIGLQSHGPYSKNAYLQSVGTVTMSQEWICRP